MASKKGLDALFANAKKKPSVSVRRKWDCQVMPESDFVTKGRALLQFLKDFARLRRTRNPMYRGDDRVLWFYDLPENRAECHSPFLSGAFSESSNYWLEVRKTPMPVRPPVPDVVQNWVRPEDLELPDKDPELLTEITVLVEKEVSNSDVSPQHAHTSIQKVPEARRLQDYPEVEEAWLEYWVEEWGPWAEKMRRWQKVQNIYETVDFMRRRLEESEERYELLLAVGLLKWRDSTGVEVKRHLLTGVAEIEFDAARGLLTVVPAASFESFKIELDMLELQDQPRLDNPNIQAKLEDLDVYAWDFEKVGEILREIANRTKGDAQVDEVTFEHSQPIDQSFRVYFAPALVFRERRPTAFEEVVNHILEQATMETPGPTTAPWERFLSEGQPNGETGPTELGHTNHRTDVPGRIFFPLPTNEEQLEIVERLSRSPYVVVKGPPGTGKSHTIANLMSHLLASGERLLVTAQAPKALTVLHEMLPADVQHLCVAALGSSREDQRLLEESVSGILRRLNEWQGPDRAQVEINRLEEELQNLEAEIATAERQLRESREAETHKHQLQGGYEGTAACIAQRLEQEQDAFSWFPDILKGQPSFPLKREDVVFLEEVHTQLTPKFEREIRLKTGNFELTSPEEFAMLIDRLREAESETQRRLALANPLKREQLQGAVKEEEIKNALQAIRQLEESATIADRVLGNLAEEILKDLLVGQTDRWHRLAEQADRVVSEFDELLNIIGYTEVSIPDDVDHSRLLADAERRLQHFENGGGKGFLFLKPRVVRETQYIAHRCTIDGASPSDVTSLNKLVAYLHLLRRLDEFKQVWPASLNCSNLGLVQLAETAKELSRELSRLLFAFKKLESQLVYVPISERVDLAGRDGRVEWLNALDAEVVVRSEQKVQDELIELHRKLRSVLSIGQGHPSLGRLSQAIDARDSVLWAEAWRERDSIREWQSRLTKYEELLKKLGENAPDLVAKLRESQGDPTWKVKVLELEGAWYWATARGWIEDVRDQESYKSLVAKSHRFRKQIEKRLEKIAAWRAWKAFFERLDAVTVQNLRAWTKAVDRIGKGTGKHAYRHRRTAREYLMKCIPKIPAWIMPLYKLWETADPEPGLFDTIIIDEASQAGLDSLILFFLAKRVIVVGDDKQNSPEAVGIPEEDIARIAREHLREFQFRDEFRPDTSLFDHAERAFGNLISLREHFRCVPEIIRFSDDLCYTDAPLIPLRQAPPDRLPPLQSAYVPDGQCEGQGQRVMNRAEAESLVRQVLRCISDSAYDGKRMGVIVLQGHAQARLIEKMLAEKLGPQVIQDRRLRCGVPATFQGDERDIIFLSLVIAPNVQYRALNRLPDQRRFNVAMSRARDQVWLFHSVQQSDLSPGDLRRRLLSFVQDPVQDAVLKLDEEREHLERTARQSCRRHGEQPEPYESWFEVDVALELLRRKYRIRPQYEVAGKRIDLVVEGIQNRLAIECDGDTWHGPERYEQDMARQRQLERAGWTFVRIRGSEFYVDRARAIEEIITACKELGIQAVDSSDLAVFQGSGDVLQSPGKGREEQAPVYEVVGLGAVAPTTGGDEANDTHQLLEQGPFSGYSPELAFPDPREAPPASVRAALRRIIQTDGPLTRTSVYRLYIECCPSLARAGKAVRQSLNRALGAMLRSGEIVQEDELQNGTPDSQVLRIAGSPGVRERPAGQRDLLEIPPSELIVVLERLNAGYQGNEPNNERLLRRLLGHYGFTRLTAVRRRYLSKVLNLYRSGGLRRG